MASLSQRATVALAGLHVAAIALFAAALATEGLDQFTGPRLLLSSDG
jgi:hypothetical protein